MIDLINFIDLNTYDLLAFMLSYLFGSKVMQHMIGFYQIYKAIKHDGPLRAKGCKPVKKKPLD